MRADTHSTNEPPISFAQYEKAQDDVAHHILFNLLIKNLKKVHAKNNRRKH